MIERLPYSIPSGNMTRACAQLNTQGMARRSSMRSEFVMREAGVSRYSTRNLTRVILAEESREALRFVHELR